MNAKSTDNADHADNANNGQSNYIKSGNGVEKLSWQKKYGKSIDSINGIQFWNNDELTLDVIPNRQIFLTFDLRLDNINIKEQTFVINGWIHVYWEWMPLMKDEFNQLDTLRDFNYNIIHDLENNGLLRDAIEFLPIHPLKIFRESSIVNVEHIHSPQFQYYQEVPTRNFINPSNAKFFKNVAHTIYHIRGELVQKLNLFSWPFDYEILNVILLKNEKLCFFLFF